MTHRSVTMRVTVAVVVGVIALSVFTLWAAEVFPQEHARSFYTVKAVVGVIAVLLTVVHMDRTWDHLRSGAQMSRYVMLLFGTVVASAGSWEQIADGVPVELRNIGGMEFLIGVCVAMIWSLREDLRRHRAHHAA